MVNKITAEQVRELLDTYIADRNRFLIDRAQAAYQKYGRGIMLLELSEAAFADAAGESEMPTPVHYHYLAGADLDGMPEDDRAVVDSYDPDKECLVVGSVALDGAEPEFAVRTVKALSPFMAMLREKGEEMRAMAKSEYRAQGRGLLLFLPPPPEMAELGDGYGAMYVTPDSGHPVFQDDPDAALLVEGYDPEREFCYIAIERDRSVVVGRASFDGREGPPIPGFTDHEDTAHYGLGRFAEQAPRPTVHDAIFGGKPKKEGSH